MSVKKLKSFVSMSNIVEEAKLSDKKLEEITNKVLFGFKSDLNSCSEWLADVKKIEELASLCAKKKNYPLPNSANVKYPLITKACYEFASRIYPEILKDGKVVKARSIGFDADGTKKQRCERIADFMNYQLLFQSQQWEKDLRVLLFRLSLIGFLCKKSYFDPIRDKIVEEICDPNDLIIHCDVKSLEDARRISHVIHLRLNNLIEFKNKGLYCKKVVDELIKQYEEDELDPKIDVVEQHTFLDLDDDNYSEPYIVTFVKETGKILRIAARYTKDMVKGSGDKLEYIDAIMQFTDYHFLVSPKGKFQSVGFGILLLHLNETINTVLNQLLDAGQLANLQGGYKDARMKNMGSGESDHTPGEFKTVKAMGGMTLKDGFFPFNFKEPSNVLFQLLGLLIQAGKELSSSTDVMTGATSADNAKTGATMALQQEGLKVFTAIQKGLYCSLTDGFRKIYTLDSIYLDDFTYYNVLDDKKSIKRKDFDLKSVDIIPTADPNLSSEVQKSYRNQVLIAAQQMPGTDPIKITKLILENSNLGIPTESIMMDEKAMNKPDPAMIEVQAKIEDMAQEKALKGHELAIEEKRVHIELIKAQCVCLELKSRAVLNLASAEEKKDNKQFNDYQMQLDVLGRQLDELNRSEDLDREDQMNQQELMMRQQEIDQNAAAQSSASGGMVGESSNPAPTE